MAQRLRLVDIRLSSLPEDLGICAGDVAGVAKIVNSVESRLILCKESGDEGWWGTWAEMAFNISQSSPFLTTPRQVARIAMVDVCRHPVSLNNQFYEYLRFGNGRMPKFGLSLCGQRSGLEAFSRNNAPAFSYEVFATPQQIAIYPTNPLDVNKRVFLQGLDPSGNTIYSLDGQAKVKGVFVFMGVPFVISPQQFSRITGIQKDVCFGDVQLFTVDPTTGNQVLFHTMEAGETTAWYRRYYFNRLPMDCCGNSVPSPCTPPSTNPSVQIHAIVKLEPIPVVTDTDYTVLQNLEAFIEEAQSRKYTKLDSITAKEMAASHHTNAVRLLNGELAHYLGIDQPAVNFKPFGSARLERVNIGMI